MKILDNQHMLAPLSLQLLKYLDDYYLTYNWYENSNYHMMGVTTPVRLLLYITDLVGEAHLL